MGRRRAPEQGDAAGDPLSALVAWNRRYVAGRGPRGTRLMARPVRELAILTCMDARIDLSGALGVAVGDAHILRNAGAVLTDDVVRSLVISQRVGETRALAVVRHTGCALLDLDEDALRSELGPAARSLQFHRLHDLEEDLRHTLGRLAASPLLRFPRGMRGFIYDVGTGRLHEVATPESIERKP